MDLKYVVDLTKDSQSTPLTYPGLTAIPNHLRLQKVTVPVIRYRTLGLG